jgi:hypothetical protein
MHQFEANSDGQVVPNLINPPLAFITAAADKLMFCNWITPECSYGNGVSGRVVSIVGSSCLLCLNYVVNLLD